MFNILRGILYGGDRIKTIYGWKIIDEDLIIEFSDQTSSSYKLMGNYDIIKLIRTGQDTFELIVFEHN